MPTHGKENSLFPNRGTPLRRTQILPPSSNTFRPLPAADPKLQFGKTGQKAPPFQKFQSKPSAISTISTPKLKKPRHFNISSSKISSRAFRIANHLQIDDILLMTFHSPSFVVPALAGGSSTRPG